MPPHCFPLGPCEMLVDAYLVTDGDEAVQAAWKHAHPDWFVAGSWTPPAQRPAGSATGADGDGWPQRGRVPGEQSSRWERAEAGFGTVLDPASLSVLERQMRVGAEQVPNPRYGGTWYRRPMGLSSDFDIAAKAAGRSTFPTAELNGISRFIKNDRCRTA